MRVHAHAPVGFTYCIICRGWQHPQWHEPVWAKGQQDQANWKVFDTYTRAPVVKPPKPETSQLSAL